MEEHNPVNADLVSKSVALIYAGHDGVKLKEILVARSWAEIQNCFVMAWDESDGCLGGSLRAYTHSTNQFDQLVVAHFNHGFEHYEFGYGLSQVYRRASECGRSACFKARVWLQELGL